jgi:hypothetical protein
VRLIDLGKRGKGCAKDERQKQEDHDSLHETVSFREERGSEKRALSFDRLGSAGFALDPEDVRPVAF